MFIFYQYLRVSSTQNVDHDLHDGLMHPQSPHQVWVLVEDLVVHDVPASRKSELQWTILNLEDLFF